MLHVFSNIFIYIFTPFLDCAYVTVTDCLILVVFHHLTPGMDTRPEGAPVEAGVFPHFVQGL